MPLIRTQEIAPDVKLGLWRIEETAEQIAERYPRLRLNDSIPQCTASKFRIMEIMLERVLIAEMTGDDSLTLEHDSSGMPLINGHNISISHTKGFEVMVMSHKKNVGVDIEYMSDRVSRIVEKFVRKDETAPDVTRQLILWSAKETVYKLFSNMDLQYFEMKSQPFDAGESGTLTMEVLRNGVSAEVCFELTNEYVLTYSMRDNL